MGDLAPVKGASHLRGNCDPSSLTLLLDQHLCGGVGGGWQGEVGSCAFNDRR